MRVLSLARILKRLTAKTFLVKVVAVIICKDLHSKYVNGIRTGLFIKYLHVITYVCIASTSVRFRSYENHILLFNMKARFIQTALCLKRKYINIHSLNASTRHNNVPTAYSL